MRAATAFATAGPQAYRRERVTDSRRLKMAGALQEALMLHRDAIARYLRARGAADEADDLLQEMWLKLTDAEGLEVDDARAYLYRTAHNLMLDRRRGEARRRLREQHYGEASSDMASPEPERTVIARERLRQIDLVLAALGPRTNHIFRRHRVSGISQRDIAVELGITLSAVEKHLQKAYKAVAGMHEDQGADFEGRAASEWRR